MNQSAVLKKCAAVCTTAALLISALPALPVQAASTLTVGKNGTYKTVGEAVKAAANLGPNSESSRVTIAIEPGTYREQRPISGAQFDNNIFQSLMKSALEQAAEDLYDMCKPGRRNKIRVTPLPEKKD